MGAVAQGSTFTSTVTFYVEDCCNCGMEFAMTTDFQRRMRENGGMFYCPRGHGQSYVTSEVERLKKKLHEAERRAASAIDNARVAAMNLEQERSRHIATKGQLTRAKKQVLRAEAGVCTICHRSFPNVRDHYRSKHKDEFEAALVAKEHGHEPHGDDMTSKAKSHWENWKLVDLRKEAQKFGIKNGSRMRKAALIHEMRVAAQEQDEQ